MTAYVITGDCNIRQLGTLSPSGSASARAGGDTIDTNGFNFTIDQDTRYGLTGTASTSFGNMTVNATKGGSINIDGRYVRLIPYTGGSGTITAGATITCGSATGVVIGLYSSLTTAPVLTGVATGWIKVTAWNNIAFPTSGSFTQGGFTFTISGASTVGWIDVIGDEAGTINANRLGQVNIRGDWFALGSTNGSAGQTFQVPTNGLLKHIAGVFIEKTPGLQDWEFYPNAGTVVFTGSTVGIGNEAERGKVCWITNTGLVTIGNGGGTGLNGYVPVSGLAVVVPNVHLENCTTAARTANVIPNATLATRYDFTTTGGGAITIDKTNIAWYPSFAQAFSVQINNTGIIDSITIAECASALNWTLVGVGNKPTTALNVSSLIMSLMFAGGTLTDCVWSRAAQPSTGHDTCSFIDIANFDFVNNTFRANTIRGAAGIYSINATRTINCNFISPKIIQGGISLSQSSKVNTTDISYVDCVSGTTVSTNVMYAIYLQNATSDCVFSGLTLPLTNCQPYTSLLYINVAGCANIKFRNIGTRASPLNLGTVNATGTIYAMATSAAAKNIKIQRVYCSNTRTGVMSADNSSTDIIEENVFGDYADAADVAAALNYTRKGRGGGIAYSAQTSVYGSHWVDNFTSTTAGRIAILMNEPTTSTLGQVTLSGGAAFTAAGGLYMPTIGMSATFETPYYIIGHTGFTNTALVMAGGTATNYSYQYQIDKNDGNGYSALSSSYTATTLGTALSAITGINASLGFKLKLKITTGTSNTAAITSVYITTSSTTTAQDYQYPLDTNTLTLGGLVIGSDIVILTAGTSTILSQVDNNPTTSYDWTFSGAQNVDIGIIKQGYVPLYIRNFSLTASDAYLPVAQVVDRNFV